MVEHLTGLRATLVIEKLRLCSLIEAPSQRQMIDAHQRRRSLLRSAAALL